jgi:hypothetical protein
MKVRCLTLLPLLLAAACTQNVHRENAARPSPEKIAQQKIVALFADHADIFKCDSFRYSDKTITATNVQIFPHPSITQDRPSATVAIKEMKITLAEDPAMDRDFRLVSLNLDEPTLVRPAALRGSTDPTETEAFLSTYITDMLDKMSNARWTKIYDLAPMVQAPGDAAQAAPNPLGELRAVNVHLLRIEMPPEKAGGTPGALVLSANFTKTSDQQWDATVQAGNQLADAEPTLAPPIHIQFKSEDAHLLARSPEANTDFAGATALDR